MMIAFRSTLAETLGQQIVNCGQWNPAVPPGGFPGFQGPCFHHVLHCSQRNAQALCRLPGAEKIFAYHAVPNVEKLLNSTRAYLQFGKPSVSILLIFIFCRAESWTPLAAAIAGITTSPLSQTCPMAAVASASRVLRSRRAWYSPRPASPACISHQSKTAVLTAAEPSPPVPGGHAPAHPRDR